MVAEKKVDAILCGEQSVLCDYYCAVPMKCIEAVLERKRCELVVGRTLCVVEYVI